MWATTSTQTPFFSLLQLPPPPAAIQLRRKNRHLATTIAAASKETNGLGQAVLSAIKSSPTNKKAQQKHQQKPNNIKKENVPENEISGSDILRALQRANAKKANIKKQQKNKGPGSGDLKNISEMKKVVDYENIRPVYVKSDWSTRLNDLEKRLQEFLPH